MKRYLVALATALCSAPAFATDVGISLAIGQPGFYGQIDIGNAPAPRLVYAQPVIVRPLAMVATPPPIYLHVAPGHARQWNRYCAQYGACERPVYFVRDAWYNEVYVPYYRGHRHEGRGRRWHRDRHG